jgi:NAD(P)-dependent dehydrogenase (short-subunit alcohol dehydrogenase family)
MAQQHDLSGRTALITGGSRGLGFAMGEAFARAGARVVLVARRQAALDEAVSSINKIAPGHAFAVRADVSSAQEAQQAHAAACAALDAGVDILVNNAGSSQRGPFENVTDAQWQTDIDLKLFAAIRLARLVLPSMKAQRWGRIINVVNTLAKTPAAGSAPTSVTRAAGIALTKVLASEFAPHNVLVNALCVGRIKSDQWEKMRAREHPQMSLDDYHAQMGRAIPLGRVGEAAEFSAIALLLASDAGGYITGTAINVDGGLSPAT